MFEELSEEDFEVLRKAHALIVMKKDNMDDLTEEEEELLEQASSIYQDGVNDFDFQEESETSLDFNCYTKKYNTTEGLLQIPEANIDYLLFKKNKNNDIDQLILRTKSGKNFILPLEDDVTE